MEQKIHGAKAAITAVIGVLTGLWGWLGWLVVGWVGLMTLDYISGSAAAAKKGEWSSKVAREGIWHKAGMIVVVIVAAGADLLLGLMLEQLPIVALPVTFAGLLCPLVLVWYCITELGSIAENAVAMGAPCPKWLRRLLEAGRTAVDQAGDGLSGEGDGDE